MRMRSRCSARGDVRGEHEITRIVSCYRTLAAADACMRVTLIAYTPRWRGLPRGRGCPLPHLLREYEEEISSIRILTRHYHTAVERVWLVVPSG